MAKEEKKEDEKLTPVGDGIETSVDDERTQDGAGEEASVKADQEDEKVGHGEEDDEGEETVDDERSKIRERRRKEKQRRTARIASDRRELEFLRKRNEDVERALSQVALRQEKLEESTVDTRIGTLEAQIREAETIHAEAIKANDGVTATEALRVKDALKEAQSKLKGGKEDRVKEREAATREREAPAKPAVDPEAVKHGRAWVESNEWFDPNLQDDDSYLARAIEERMAREGRFDPRTPDYWEELNRRIDKRLPGLRTKKSSMKDERDSDDLWDEDDEKPQKTESKKPKGPRISVGGKTRALKPNEVHISQQRKEAMMAAGVWDDPETRERYLRSYKRYDEEARSRNNS